MHHVNGSPLQYIFIFLLAFLANAIARPHACDWVDIPTWWAKWTKPWPNQPTYRPTPTSCIAVWVGTQRQAHLPSTRPWWHQNGWSRIPFLSTVEYVRLGTYIRIQYLLPNMAIWTWGHLLSQTRARAWTTLHHLEKHWLTINLSTIDSGAK